MKKIVLAVLIILLLALTFPSIPKVSATTTEDLWTTPGLPEEIPSEPISDSPSGDYLNTTNPYAEFQVASEESEAEGDKPLYVLVFGDEEERAITRPPRQIDPPIPIPWDVYGGRQLERGDEALVENFGIDIRILGFLEWDSDDSKDTMEKLWYELESDTEGYLGHWYNGETWSGYVDAIIGITAQETPNDPTLGLAPRPHLLDQWRIFILLKWKVYWADDNLVQHEVSHLFYAPHHDDTCCAMADHSHFVWFIWEDAILWIVFDNVICSYTSYHWCGDCSVVINQKKSRYSGPFLLTIYADSGGTTDPPPGTYEYPQGTSLVLTKSASAGYEFRYWVVDGVVYTYKTIIVTMNSDHTVKAYFLYSSGGGGGGGGGPYRPKGRAGQAIGT